MNPNYSNRKQKIYSDYKDQSTDKLISMLNERMKYLPEIIEVIEDILIERDAVEIEGKDKSQLIQTKLVKQRHWFVTLWLLLIMALNFYGSIVTLAGNDDYQQDDLDTGNLKLWLLPLLVINLYFVLLVFSWKKKGFWGLAITYAISILMMVYLTKNNSLLLGLVSIGILHMILQLKAGGKSYWENME